MYVQEIFLKKYDEAEDWFRQIQNFFNDTLSWCPTYFHTALTDYVIIIIPKECNREPWKTSRYTQEQHQA